MYYCKTVLLEIDAAARTKSPWLMRWHIWIVGTFSQKHFSKGWTLAKGTCRSGSPWDSQYSWTDTACKWVRLDHPQIPQSMIRIYYHTPAASSEDQGAWVCAHHQLHQKAGQTSYNEGTWSAVCYYTWNKSCSYKQTTCCKGKPDLAERDQQLEANVKMGKSPETKLHKQGKIRFLEGS